MAPNWHLRISPLGAVKAESAKKNLGRKINTILHEDASLGTCAVKLYPLPMLD